MIKGPLFGWSVCQLDWNNKHLKVLVHWVSWLLIIVFLCVVINLLAPGVWLTWLLEDFAYAERSRFGLPIVVGPFAHPGYFGTLMAMSALALLTFRHEVSRSLFSAFLLAGSLLSVVVGFRRKTLISLPLSVAAYAYFAKRRWLPLILSPAIIALAIVSWNFVANVLRSTAQEYLENPDQVARLRLTMDAPVLARDHFPFGVGFGRFASGAARQDYSPVYTELGYEGIWGLGPTEENGKFLTDTFWPAIVGESGFLGTFFFVGGLAAIFVYARRRHRSEDQWGRWLGLTAILWSMHLFFESFVEPVYSSTPVFGLFFGFIGILVGYRSYSSVRPPKLMAANKVRKTK
ncbi:O-antigen ligase family protein [Kocuria himachalensis]